MQRESVLSKVRKLYAHAESAAKLGNQAEAEAFAGKAQELLLEHKLSMSEVEMQRQDEDDPMGRIVVEGDQVGVGKSTYRVHWQQQLASIVARAHFCRIIVYPGSNKIAFVGRNSDRELAIYVYGLLVRTSKDVAETEHKLFAAQCKRAGTPERAQGFKDSWRIGFYTAIKERYAAERAKAQAAHSNCTALVVVNDKAVERYMATMKLSKGTPIGSRQINQNGVNAGYKYGQGVNIRSNGIGTTARGGLRQIG